MVEESYKQQLEGLLQARSEDIRDGLRPRRRQVAAAAVLEPPKPPGPPSLDIASARRCEACGAEIDARRLRAMPHATLCLECRRAAERAGTRS